MTKPKSFALTALSKVRCGMPSVNPDDNPAEGYRIRGKRKIRQNRKRQKPNPKGENADDAILSLPKRETLPTLSQSSPKEN